ncbi:MAG: hypothetical protein DME05_25970 [Candidatus Rokuibacteriota bacterium]|nr:MAG: hypothetical protein DME05_25970 [Candidatus Rokubacteria bacterium]
MPHDARTSMTNLPIWRRLAWRLGASFLLLTAIAVLLSGFLQYRAQEQWLRQSLGSLLLNIGRTGALLVDGDLHQAVVAAARSDTPDYARLRRELVRIQETNRLGDAVYTLTDVQGATARFAVISNGLAPVGLEYRLAPEIQPILRRVLTEGVPAYTGIYVSSSGTWITAFAPVKNSAGQTVAALDVDFRVDVYLGELAAVRRRFYLHSLAGAVLALIAGVLLARQITRPVVQLSGLARSIVEGHFSTRVRIAARDEIGMLGNVLHLMAERLNVSHRSMTEVLVRALEARGEATGSLRRLADASAIVSEHLSALSCTTSVRSGFLRLSYKSRSCWRRTSGRSSSVIRSGAWSFSRRYRCLRLRSTWSVAITSATTGPGTLTASRERRFR